MLTIQGKTVPLKFKVGQTLDWSAGAQRATILILEEAEGAKHVRVTRATSPFGAQHNAVIRRDYPFAAPVPYDGTIPYKDFELEQIAADLRDQFFPGHP